MHSYYIIFSPIFLTKNPQQICSNFKLIEFIQLYTLLKLEVQT